MTDPILHVGEADFRSAVLEASKRVPVIVDFWAPWCGPCRTLGPILEELALAAEGRWILAKIDSDENPGLSQEYGVRGIPAVKAFVDGRVVSEFTGALPRAAIEEFLAEVVPGPADELAREAARAGQAGARERELELWSEVLELEPGQELARVRRARLRAAASDDAGARADLEGIGPDSDLREEADRLVLLLDWADRVKERGGIDEIRRRAGENPDDVAARHDLGCALAIAGAFDGALAEFLEVVRRDRAYGDDAGRLAMLAVFGLLGHDHPLTGDWRGKLASILF